MQILQKLLAFPRKYTSAFPPTQLLVHTRGHPHQPNFPISWVPRWLVQVSDVVLEVRPLYSPRKLRKIWNNRVVRFRNKKNIECWWCEEWWIKTNVGRCEKWRVRKKAPAHECECITCCVSTFRGTVTAEVTTQSQFSLEVDPEGPQGSWPLNGLKKSSLKIYCTMQW